MAPTRSCIAEQLRSGLGFSRKKALQTIDPLLERIKTSRESGDGILASGFGKFRAKKKWQRRGRNPASGQAMMLRFRKVVAFEYSGTLSDKANAKEYWN